MNELLDVAEASDVGRENLTANGYFQLSGYLNRFLTTEPDGELSLAEIALREAWVYAHHDRFSEDERVVRILSHMQHGILQQAFRMSLLMCLLACDARGTNVSELYAFPVPTEFGTKGISNPVLRSFEQRDFLNSASGSEACTMVYSEITVASPKSSEPCYQILSNWESSTSISELLAKMAQDGHSMILLDDEWMGYLENEEIIMNEVGKECGTVVVSCLGAPRLMYPSSEEKLPYLRIPVAYCRAVTKNNLEKVLEKDDLGKLDDLKRSLSRLTGNMISLSGEFVPVNYSTPWHPVTRLVPESSVGAAIAGDVLWDDPCVFNELNDLLHGDLGIAKEMIRSDLAKYAIHIRKSWSAFQKAEQACYGENSGVLALEQLLNGRRLMDVMKGYGVE